jgi:hypothetical protein
MESGTTEKISLSELLNREIGRVAKNFEEYKKKRAEKVPEKKSSSDWFKNLMENLDKVSKSLATADSSKVPEKKDVEIEKVKPTSKVSVGEVPITTDDVEKDKLEKYIAFSTAVAVDTFMKNKRIEAAEVEKARLEAEKVRLEAEEAEKARIAAEEAEKARIAAEEAEKARIAAEEAEKARIAAEEAEKARLEAEEAEKARIAAEEAEKARIAAEEAEKARLEAEKAKIAAEEAEKARIAAEEAEKARIAAEEAEKARIAAEEAEKAEKKIISKTAISETAIDVATSVAVAMKNIIDNSIQKDAEAKQKAESEQMEAEELAAKQKAKSERMEAEELAAKQKAESERMEAEDNKLAVSETQDDSTLINEITNAVSIAVAIHANQSKEPMPELYKKESLEPMITVAIANAIKDSVKVDKKKYASIISSIISALLMALVKRRSAIIKQSSETPSEEKEKEKEKEEELEIPKETTTIKDVAVDTSKSEKIIDDHLHKLCKETFDKKYENMKPGVEAVYTSHDDQYCYGMLFTKEERDGIYVDKSVENVKCPFNKPYEPGANKDEYRVECDKKDNSTPEDKKDDAKNTETESDKNTENQTGIEKVDSPSDLKPETDIKPTKEFKDQQIAAAIANVVKKGVKRKKSSNVPLRKSPRLQQQAIAISAAIPAN